MKITYTLKIYRICLSIHKNESEVWINYSAGVNTKFNLARSKTPWKLTGGMPRLLIFFRWLILHSSFKSLYLNKKQLCIFSGSINQYSSLKSTIKSMLDKNIPHINFIDRNIPFDSIASSSTYHIKFQPMILIVGLIIFVRRFAHLLSILNKKDSNLIRRRLNSFLEIYFWLPFFVHCLIKLDSKYILTSNDHNQSNRCLILAAKYLRVKTIYIQHAAVSTRFHRLQFDYSFLDGQHAFDIYKKCEKNSSKNFLPPSHRHVFLSGIKKKLYVKYQLDTNKIGISLKEADHFDQIIDVIKYLNDKNYTIYLRWHPASSFVFIRKLAALVSQFSNNVYISDPKIEGVNSFFKKVSTVISSNSTILLESRLSALRSIYYEFGPVSVFDYYGFVEKGIAVYASSLKELTYFIELPLLNNDHTIQNLKYYTHTYNTPWVSREGDLMVHCLDAINSNIDISGLFGFRSFDPGTPS